MGHWEQGPSGILLRLLEKALANMMAGLALTDAAVTVVVGSGECTSCDAALSSVLGIASRERNTLDHSFWGMSGALGR